MNYAELQQAVLDNSHRPDLVADVPTFIRLAEGAIARELRSAEQIERVLLDETDRDTGGIFNLPTNYLEERSLWIGDAQLVSVSLAELRRMRGSVGRVRWFAVLGRQIEFRSVPATDSEIELLYFTRPAALAAPTDTNPILEKHEGVYLYGALRFLYTFTQDLELAADAAQLAAGAIETLNEQAGRQIGGARTAAPYQFSSRRSY